MATKSTSVSQLPRLSMVLDAIDCGCLIIDDESKIRLCNHWFLLRSEYASADVIGQKFFDLFPSMEGGRVQDGIDAAIEYGCPSLISNPLNRSPFPLFELQEDDISDSFKRRFQQSIIVTPLNGESGDLFCLIQIMDVTPAAKRELELDQEIMERKQTEHELVDENRDLHRLAIKDSLTGLANRRYLDQFLDQALAHCQRNQQSLSLIMIDIDHFKAYNDFYGHLHGDQCLQSVANGLENELKRASDLIARYGGEEFCAVLPNTSQDAAEKLAETMRAAIVNLHIQHADSPEGQVTVSLGTATCDHHAMLDAAKLIQEADMALYVAKRAGRNQISSFISTETLNARD